jgi:hypothetical protein
LELERIGGTIELNNARSRYDKMTADKKSALGKKFLLVGCAWFTLDFFWLPPLMLLLGWLSLPGVFYKILVRAEFVLSALMAATGILMWRGAARKLSPLHYIVVYSTALAVVLVVFNLYGFIHLSN